MSAKKVVIIGGTGLIGSYLAADLVQAGHQVSVLSRSTRFSAPDALLSGLKEQIKIVHGEHSDQALLVEVLSGADVVYHKALSQGASGAVENAQQFLQSKLGAACALAAALRQVKKKPALLVMGSSIAVYGEGSYQCSDCGTVRPELRYRRLAPAGDSPQSWNPACPSCGKRDIKPVFLDETSARRGESIYAVEKKAEEDLIAAACKQMEINLAVLRYGTVIGAGQSWHSPFTHFLDVLHAGEPLIVHEDGQQTRDFMFGRDAAQANKQAMDNHKEGVHFYNVVSGRPRTMLEFMERLSEAFSAVVRKKPASTVVQTDGKLISGDVRHCHVSGAKAEKDLDFVARQQFGAGLGELVEWYCDKKSIAVNV